MGNIYIHTYFCALNYFVPMCAHFSCAYVPTTTHKIPRIFVFLRIIWSFIPFKTPKQTPAYKTAYPNPILCGFCTSTVACTETIIVLPSLNLQQLIYENINFYQTSHQLDICICQFWGLLSLNLVVIIEYGPKLTKYYTLSFHEVKSTKNNET